VHAVKDKQALPVGFFNSGTQIVTATTVDMGNGLPKIDFAEVQKLAGDPAATAAFYAPWISSIQDDGLLKGMQPLAAESE
jgi:hypothetical protein